MSSDFAAKAGSMSKPMAEKPNLLGLEVSELTTDVAKQLGLEGHRGVLVTDVDSGSSVAAGIEAGSIIVQVNRQDVNSVEEFEKAVKADDDGSVLLLVRTDQGSSFVVVGSNLQQFTRTLSNRANQRASISATNSRSIMGVRLI